MDQKKNKTIAWLLFAVLFMMSFFKDQFTPDYFNTPSAFFLDPSYHLSRLSTISTHLSFWVASLLYSLIFILFPYLVVGLYFQNKMLSRFVLFILILMFVVIYVMVFAGNNILDRAIIPKLNRYFHSPLMVLFFIAAFTLTQRKDGK